MSKNRIFVNICQKWEKCQKHAVLCTLFDDFLKGRKTTVFREKRYSPFFKKVLFLRFSRYWELKTRKNPISQIARNVPRIRHLLERPRRTFLPHEGHRVPNRRFRPPPILQRIAESTISDIWRRVKRQKPFCDNPTKFLWSQIGIVAFGDLLHTRLEPTFSWQSNHTRRNYIAWVASNI